MADAGDLLTCPFCGGDDLNVYHGHGGNKVQCRDCGVSGVHVMIWNRRADLRNAFEMANAALARSDANYRAWLAATPEQRAAGVPAQPSQAQPGVTVGKVRRG